MVRVTAVQAKILGAQRQKLMTSTIDMFRPTQFQEEFFLTIEREGLLEILLGGGNRGGKSTCASVAMAAAILNKPVTFRDRSQHHMRNERWRKEGLRIWIIGKNWNHIGDTIYRLLFEEGTIRVLKDPVTGKRRAWNPEDPHDQELFAITEPSQPLIGMDDILDGEDGISWEDKKGHQVRSLTLKHDGTKLLFYPSSGAIKQGDPVHIIWIDEHIENDNWYHELKVRLVDYRGWLLWTAWADTAPSAVMASIRDRAELEAATEKPATFAIDLDGTQNPFTQSDHREKIMSAMDPEERASRDTGKADYSRWKTYWHFSRFVHCTMKADPDSDDAIAACLRYTKVIPYTWTRYMILDPGSTHAGVLFVAVPPPFEFFTWEKNGDKKHKEQFGDAIIPYDEIYVPNLSANPIAEAVKAKALGTYFEDFIIDPRAARQTPMGFSGTVGSNYEKAFREQDLRCLRRGSNFSFGSDEVDSRILKTQGYMNIGGSGKPRLRLHGCPNLAKQIERYRWGDDGKGNPTHKPAKRQHIDLVVCLEYIVSRDDCGYVKPPEMPKAVDDKSRDAVIRNISGLFGRSGQATKGVDRSIYCGAGERPN